MTDKKEPKIIDLTMGAGKPKEKVVTRADGSKMYLDDPTHHKSKEELEQERQERVKESKVSE